VSRDDVDVAFYLFLQKQTCAHANQGVTIVRLETDGTSEETGTLTQGGALFSLVPLVWN
jgi:hypothetical protein